MKSYFYVEYDPISYCVEMALNLDNPKKTIPLYKELRLNIDPVNKCLLFITAHRELQPAAIFCEIEIFNEDNVSLDVTFSIKAMHKQLKKMKGHKYVKITVENNCIKIQPATYGGGLFQEDDNNFYALERPVENKVFTQHTALLTDYEVIKCSPKDLIFPIRKSFYGIVDRIYRLASELHKPFDSRVIFNSSENQLQIELFSIGAYSKFSVLSDEFNDATVEIDFVSLRFLKKTLSLFFKLGFKEVNFEIVDNKEIIVSCGKLLVMIGIPKEEKFYEKARVPNSKSGWIEVPNARLLMVLDEVDVAPTPADDIVELKLIDHEICAQVVTDINSANYQIPDDVSRHPDLTSVLLNRKLLLNALKFFNTFDIIKIHGLIIKSSKISLMSVNSSSNLVVLSVSENSEQEI